MKRLLTRARNDNYRIIYIDETMFTRTTLPETEWARPMENMTVDEAMKNEPTLALLAGISKEKGTEHFMVFEKSVNKVKFKEYLEGIRMANPDAKICLFMDNLAVHSSEHSKKVMRDFGFRFIYNCAYQPDYNPIESCFSMVKRNFKALRAKKFIGLIQDSHKAMVE